MNRGSDLKVFTGELMAPFIWLPIISIVIHWCAIAYGLMSLGSLESFTSKMIPRLIPVALPAYKVFVISILPAVIVRFVLYGKPVQNGIISFIVAVISLGTGLLICNVISFTPFNRSYGLVVMIRDGLSIFLALVATSSLLSIGTISFGERKSSASSDLGYEAPSAFETRRAQATSALLEPVVSESLTFDLNEKMGTIIKGSTKGTIQIRDEQAQEIKQSTGTVAKDSAQTAASNIPEKEDDESDHLTDLLRTTKANEGAKLTETPKQEQVAENVIQQPHHIKQTPDSYDFVQYFMWLNDNEKYKRFIALAESQNPAEYCYICGDDQDSNDCRSLDNRWKIHRKCYKSLVSELSKVRSEAAARALFESSPNSVRSFFFIYAHLDNAKNSML